VGSWVITGRTREKVSNSTSVKRGTARGRSLSQNWEGKRRVADLRATGEKLPGGFCRGGRKAKKILERSKQTTTKKTSPWQTTNPNSGKKTKKR